MPDYKTVGDFLVNRDDDAVLGRGAMGTLYMAHLTTKQPVAAKEIWIGDNEEDIQKAKKEVDIMSTFSDHPNIIKILGHAFTGKQLWIFTEFCELGNLDDFCKKHDISPSLRFDMMIQMCQAVEHLHMQDPPMTHRDIKPQNILITRQKEHRVVVKLCDFGVSSMAGAAGKFHTFARMQHDEYMAPELFDLLAHIHDDIPYNVSVDIFSLGLLILDFPDALKRRLSPLLGM